MLKQLESIRQFLADKQGELFTKYYAEWYSRSTLTSWEECFEHTCYDREYAEYHQQIEKLDKIIEELEK